MSCIYASTIDFGWLPFCQSFGISYKVSHTYSSRSEDLAIGNLSLLVKIIFLLIHDTPMEGKCGFFFINSQTEMVELCSRPSVKLSI